MISPKRGASVVGVGAPSSDWSTGVHTWIRVTGSRRSMIRILRAQEKIYISPLIIPNRSLSLVHNRMIRSLRIIERFGLFTRGGKEMVQVYLSALECIRTKIEIKEEPYVLTAVDGVQYGCALGPYDMRRGDTVYLERHLQGREIGISLMEEDKMSSDECYGTYSLVEGESPDAVGSIDSSGQHFFNFPRTGKTRYKLYFLVAADHSNFGINTNCLYLWRIRCNDAQQSTDHVYIKVNGETLWGPTRMKTGDEEQIGVRTDIPITSSIQLWEEDSRKDDFFGELRLVIGEHFPTGALLTHRFSADKGIAGDAAYTLYYTAKWRRMNSRREWQPC